MNAKKGLFLGLLFAFFAIGFIAIQKATPDAKPHRIYKEIKVYSPYKFEKTIGGLAIIDSRTGTKEKPDAADSLYRMDELDQQWGKNHLKIVENDVVVLGDNNQTVSKIFIQTQKERDWLKKFFGI
ncbi:hypothetical protein [Sulfurimonas autotrophica]|uniref:Uncharacterized protein n=1 Tax=Sulfurimonas autotrophica (strain ATCC BAA-671 / DSM 16294 / JCM 11897 / OK10) TaxID=563040 RepID=E0UR66_SULAO|nr:hypothetical protein [Sulfurimonas autotrophica]ADN08876.1 conserved hypothetical protein [Sulfurimonas autotrophica DSM 16294]